MLPLKGVSCHLFLDDIIGRISIYKAAGSRRGNSVGNKHNLGSIATFSAANLTCCQVRESLYVYLAFDRSAN